jgi:hypothetical protein
LTVVISVLSLAALVLAICCTVLFAIAAAIELLPPRPAQPRDGEHVAEQQAGGFARLARDD